MDMNCSAVKNTMDVTGKLVWFSLLVAFDSCYMGKAERGVGGKSNWKKTSRVKEWSTGINPSFFSSECDKKILHKELMCSHLGINIALFLENFLYIRNFTVLISVTKRYFSLRYLSVFSHLCLQVPQMCYLKLWSCKPTIPEVKGFKQLKTTKCSHKFNLKPGLLQATAAAWWEQ